MDTQDSLRTHIFHGLESLLLDLNQLASAAVESGLLMLNQKQKLMLITVIVDTDVMDMGDTDTDVDTDMEDMDTISARDLLMPKPSHTTVITVTHMLMDIIHMAFIMLPKLPLLQRPVSLDIQEQPPPSSPEAHKVSASKLSY